MTGPVFLYLHGFASSPESPKARSFVAWGAARGLRIDRLDLRVPSFEKLRLSAMKTRIRDAISGASGGASRARAVLIGSSLGGLAACRVAEEDPRVSSLFLMAPAFRLAERWKTNLGAAGVERWRTRGWLDVDDHAQRKQSRIDYGFLTELEELDAASNGWPDVRVPTCIVHGVRDEVVDVRLSREWAIGKRHVRLVEVEDAHELSGSMPLILREAQDFLVPYLG